MKVIMHGTHACAYEQSAEEAAEGAPVVGEGHEAVGVLPVGVRDQHQRLAGLLHVEQRRRQLGVQLHVAAAGCPSRQSHALPHAGLRGGVMRAFMRDTVACMAAASGFGIYSAAHA